MAPGRFLHSHPYIYSDVEIVAIIEHARMLPSFYGPSRPDLLDAESGVLHIQQGKFGKERLLLLDPSVVQRPG
ncbi:hypothetical protein K1W69_12035 [Hoeflea sp. WL0058]|uniref:Uncharacterized protein n=1 Tax=Flavimaribacter sediminis TaxID=2865987 RepID=A0AAE2ZP73_9HYPH|nr:hypothetical protein [Flavimaribacter sediminis]MBW8637918.1 hypothetical protein [Flavimaribacter sediminis]